LIIFDYIWGRSFTKGERAFEPTATIFPVSLAMAEAQCNFMLTLSFRFRRPSCSPPSVKPEIPGQTDSGSISWMQLPPASCAKIVTFKIGINQRVRKAHDTAPVFAVLQAENMSQFMHGLFQNPLSEKGRVFRQPIISLAQAGKRNDSFSAFSLCQSEYEIEP